MSTASGEDEDEVPVRILGFPLHVYAESAEHHASLLREFWLVAVGCDDEQSHPTVPRRLLRLVDDVTERYRGLSDAQNAERDAALTEGRATVDLDFRVPPGVAEAALALDRLLDEADEFCRQGDLLTLAAPPHVRAFRHWYLGEFARQVGGERATPWPRFLERQPQEVRVAVEGASAR